MILYPRDALSASLRGLDLWWEVVFPSLLPFFITAELLIGFGVVHGLGALSERLMRPLFNVPGCGGFVWVMGMASGYPSGAKWTADLRKKGQVTRIEAERLVAFTNASSPLFIFGAIAVGFFHDASLGILIAAAHYGGNFLVGMAMRFYKKHEEESPMDRKSSTWRDAFHKMHQSRLEDGRTLGKLMGDAVTRSVDTLLMVGGFIMLFSVLTELLKQTGAIHIFSHLLFYTGIPESFHVPFTAGMLELTTGIGAITETHEPLLSQLVIVSFILGFHGFSIQAQIASILAETDIRFKPYALARIAHGFTAASLVFVLYHLFRPYQQQSMPIWNPNENFTTPIIEFFTHYGPPITLLMIMLMIAVKWNSQRRIKNDPYEYDA
ncbi:sporulation integral membrane protein YlbJ [Halobacillus karajensis]|uniref:Sporulation integral membrane protein YlbJ n=1 Tax=Halobacillus karajensis TaxID=195088 RepID=A0A024P324_9BACI|nr:Sporulation integral membrane protein YlbJ [Halobacillus karajensis]CDQ22321.1 Sporulation integral membrane protein YlbJ [Halobacillus karajensis]CDQ28162.1 Sporulation integral membrane protein YlbJ [Halobacillus karajensis]SEH70879.1 sporulation integral membrane protein YlbJ [Halobacillus karajensis]